MKPGLLLCAVGILLCAGAQIVSGYSWVLWIGALFVLAGLFFIIIDRPRKTTVR